MDIAPEGAYVVVQDTNLLRSFDGPDTSRSNRGQSAVLLAAKWAAASRRRGLGLAAARPDGDKDKEIIFLRDRVAGLLHAAFIAMMVDALIERTLRHAMIKNKIEKLVLLPEQRLTSSPTTARLLEAFSDIVWYEFRRAGELVTFPIKLTSVQRQLLKLLGIDPRAAYG